MWQWWKDDSIDCLVWQTQEQSVEEEEKEEEEKHIFLAVVELQNPILQCFSLTSPSLINDFTRDRGKSGFFSSECRVFQDSKPEREAADTDPRLPIKKR